MAAMSETRSPLPIHNDGEHVFIELPRNQRIKITPDTARKFATRLLAEANRAEGKTGMYFIAEVTK